MTQSVVVQGKNVFLLFVKTAAIVSLDSDLAKTDVFKTNYELLTGPISLQLFLSVSFHMYLPRCFVCERSWSVRESSGLPLLGPRAKRTLSRQSSDVLHILTSKHCPAHDTVYVSEFIL